MGFRDETTKTTESDFGARLLSPRDPDHDGDTPVSPFPPGVGREPEVIEFVTPLPALPSEEEPTGPSILEIKAEPRRRRQHTPETDEEIACALAEYRKLIRSGRLPS